MVGKAHRCIERKPVINIGRPRIEDKNKTLKALKPWATLGMSERTWFRRRAERKAKAAT